MNFSSIHKFCITYTVAILRRSKSCMNLSGKKMQVFTQKRIALSGNTEWDVQDENYDYHQEVARSAFADMLHDTERNKKYQRALQLAIEKMHKAGKKANVLDIGTGTGLLSIMAVKCGADSITACEAFEPMAECCLKILERNGVADKITVIPKRSTEIKVGEDGDMKEKANILVTEVFDTELIGEGALLTFNHAHKYLLEKDCIVVPDSAVVYAQVIECPTLHKWHKLGDFQEYGLKTPRKMKNCPGTAAVHDIQLSQLPRSAFRELSDEIPIFYYDWSGKTKLPMHRSVRVDFTATKDGYCQMVFMWWELNMDPEGRICLSCAPWWCHPDAITAAERPQDTIPWRDHWMQAVYYFPKQHRLEKGDHGALTCCQDEYSLWFYLNDQCTTKRPVCDCGVHMALSRTHVSYWNDKARAKIFANHLKETLTKKSVVLDLNGASLLGLHAAKTAETVYILEDMKYNLMILQDYVKDNGLKNVNFVSELTDDVLGKVTDVVCDPNFTSAILPWENLKVAYLLHKYKDGLKDVTVMPDGFELWALPVDFQDLHKIRVPLDRCEGIDMSIFDELVESSREISDSELEPQPLWEYPCRSRGRARKILDIDIKNLKPTYAVDGEYHILEAQCEDAKQPMNAFAAWCVWRAGGARVCGGPVEEPRTGGWVRWDPHTRQAVRIFKKAHIITCEDKWSYQIAIDLNKGQFDVSLDLVQE